MVKGAWLGMAKGAWLGMAKGAWPVTEQSSKKEESRKMRVGWNIFATTNGICRGAKMEWICQRCHRESISQPFFRPRLLVICLVVVFTMVMYPALRSLGFQLQSALTGSYIPGHHSILLINCPNEQIARGIGRILMEGKLAASINIFPKSSIMYYWKGEIQDATEIILLAQTRTSRVQKLIEKVESVHPYDIPEILSFPVEYGSLPYLKWIDEAVPAD